MNPDLMSNKILINTKISRQIWKDGMLNGTIEKTELGHNDCGN